MPRIQRYTRRLESNELFVMHSEKLATDMTEADHRQELRERFTRGLQNHRNFWEEDRQLAKVSNDSRRLRLAVLSEHCQAAHDGFQTWFEKDFQEKLYLVVYGIQTISVSRLCQIIFPPEAVNLAAPSTNVPENDTVDFVPYLGWMPHGSPREASLYIDPQLAKQHFHPMRGDSTLYHRDDLYIFRSKNNPPPDVELFKQQQPEADLDNMERLYPSLSATTRAF